MGRSNGRGGSDPDRGSNEADGQARTAGETGHERSKEVTRTNDSPQGTRGTLSFSSVLTSVSSVSSVVTSLICAALVIGQAPAAAQMAGNPAAGYKREAGTPASALPAPLREIGFDQNLDR